MLKHNSRYYTIDIGRYCFHAHGNNIYTVSSSSHSCSFLRLHNDTLAQSLEFSLIHHDSSITLFFFFSFSALLQHMYIYVPFEFRNKFRQCMINVMTRLCVNLKSQHRKIIFYDAISAFSQLSVRFDWSVSGSP